MKKDHDKGLQRSTPVGTMVDGIVIGLSEKRCGNLRQVEDLIQQGRSLSSYVFSHPELLWLFTDATEAEVRSMGLDPIVIDEWGCVIEDDCLPVSPHFRTVETFIAYLLDKVKAGSKVETR